VQASGVQTTSRNARVNVEGVDHGNANIVLKDAAAIATKARTRTASRQLALAAARFNARLSGMLA
jgi:hypothetical protein